MCGKWKSTGYESSLSKMDQNTLIFQKLDSEIFPYSVQHSQRELNWIRGYRICILTFILAVFLPYFDLFLRHNNTSLRLRYFYNRKEEMNVDISSLPASGLTLDLQNCEVNLKTHMRKNIEIDYNIPISVEATYKDGVFKAHDKNDAAMKCKVKLFLPSSTMNITLPSLTIKSSGTDIIQKLRLFDKFMKSGDYLNFGSNSFTFIGTVMYVDLHRPHRMSSLSVTQLKGVVNITNVVATTVKIQVEEGAIEYKSSAVFTKLTASEGNSQICMTGGSVTTTSTTSYCIANTVAAKVADIPTTPVDSTKLCTITADICNTTCPGTHTQTAELIVYDGSIQFQQATTGTVNSYSLLRDHLQLSASSQSIMRDIKSHVKDDTREDILYILDVFMPGYKAVWMYSTKTAFIVARPWMLSIVSLTLINPNTERHSLFLSQKECPGADVTTTSGKDAIDRLVSRQLRTLLKTTDEKEVGILVIRKKGGIYYTYEQNFNDATADREVQITDGRGYMIATLSFSLFVAVVSSFILMYGIYRMLYSRFLDSKLNLLKAKKDTKQDQIQTQEYLDHIDNNVLVKGFCKERFKLRKKKIKQLGNVQEELKSSSLVRFGFFQVISLYMEYLQRKNTNSLKKMIQNNIQESSAHFPNHDIKNNVHLDKSKYVTLQDFRQVYKKYCVKFGYNPMDLEDNKDDLEKYGIVVETIQSPETQAYTRIRWRRDGEVKSSKAYQDKSVISNFIGSQCVVTSLDHDYILTEDLQEKYEKFIMKMYGYKSDYEPIAGSSELETLGLVIKNVPIQIMRNVTYVNPKLLEETQQVTLDQKAQYRTNMVRIPDSQFRPWYDIEKHLKKSKLAVKIKAAIFSSTGFLVNLFYVIVHLLAIAVVIIPINVLAAWVMLEETQYDSDPFQTGFDEYDILYPDYEEFWFSSLKTELRMYLWVQLITSCVFIIIALVNLYFYYTSMMSRQNYRISRTFCNKLFNYPFRMFIIVLTWIYLAYISLFLIWWMLGAIINPQKFLPYATTSLSFISYVIYKYNTLQQFYKDIKKVVEKEITKHMVKLQQDVISNIYNTDSTISAEDENQSLDKLVKKQSREFIIYTFVSAFGKDVNDLKKQLRTRLNEGELHAYVELISQVVGIHPMITLSIFGVLKKDRSLMVESAHEFANEFNLSKQMCVAITDICLENYMPRHFGIEETPKSVIMKIKPLFRIFLHDFNQDFLEGLLGIVLEKNMNRMVSHFDKVNITEDGKLIPLELFHLLLSMKVKNKYLSDKTKTIVKQVLEDKEDGDNNYNLKQVSNLINDLISIYEKSYKLKLNHVKLIQQDKNLHDDIVAQTYIAPYMSDNHENIHECVRRLMKQMFKKRINEIDLTEGELQDYCRTSFMNLFNYVSQNQIEVDRYQDFSKEAIGKSAGKFTLRNLKLVCKGQRQEFLKLIIKLDIDKQYEIMDELFLLLTRPHTEVLKMNHLAYALKLPFYYSHVLFQLAHFFAAESDENLQFDKNSPLSKEFAGYRTPIEKVKKALWYISCGGCCKLATYPCRREELETNDKTHQRMLMYQVIDQLTQTMVDSILSLSILLKAVKWYNDRRSAYNHPKEVHNDYLKAITTLASLFDMEESQLELIIDITSGVPEVIFKTKKVVPDFHKKLTIREEVKGQERDSEQSWNEEPEMDDIDEVNHDDIQLIEKLDHDKRSRILKEIESKAQHRIIYLSKIVGLKTKQLTNQVDLWIQHDHTLNNGNIHTKPLGFKKQKTLYSSLIQSKNDKSQKVSQMTEFNKEETFHEFESLEGVINQISNLMSGQEYIQSQYEQQKELEMFAYKYSRAHINMGLNETNKSLVKQLHYFMKGDLVTLYFLIQEQDKYSELLRKFSKNIVTASLYPSRIIGFINNLVDQQIIIEDIEGEDGVGRQTIADGNAEFMESEGEEGETMVEQDDQKQIDNDFKYKLKQIKFEQFTLTLLLLRQQLVDRFESTRMNESEHNIIKNEIIRLAPAKFKKHVNKSLLDIDNFQESLLQTGIFFNLSEKLLKISKKEMKDNPNIVMKQNNYYGVLKLIYGRAINSRAVISSSIMELITNCKDRFLLEGILSIINKDLEKDQEIFYAARKFGLSPSVLMTLMSICSHDQKGIAANISKTFNISSQYLSCLLSLRMDKLSISFLAQKLKIDSKLLNMILSFGYRGKAKSEAYFTQICDSKKFTSESDVKAIIDISQGYTLPVKYIKLNMRSYECMTITDIGLAESLVFLYTTGREVRRTFQIQQRGRYAHPDPKYSSYELEKHLTNALQGLLINRESQFINEFIDLIMLLWAQNESGAEREYVEKLIEDILSDIDDKIVPKDEKFDSDLFNSYFRTSAQRKFTKKLIYGILMDEEDYEVIRQMIEYEENQQIQELRFQRVCSFLALASADYDGIEKYCKPLCDDLQLKCSDNDSQKIQVLYETVALSNPDYAYKNWIDTDGEIDRKKFDYLNLKDQRICAIHLIQSISPNQLFRVLEQCKTPNDNIQIDTMNPIQRLLTVDLKFNTEQIQVLNNFYEMVMGMIYADCEKQEEMLVDYVQDIQHGQADIYLELCSTDPGDFKNAIEAKLQLEYPELSELLMNTHEFIYGADPEQALISILESNLIKYYSIESKKNMNKYDDLQELEESKQEVYNKEQESLVFARTLLQTKIKLAYRAIANKTSLEDEELHKILDNTDKNKDVKWSFKNEQFLFTYKIIKNCLLKKPWQIVQEPECTKLFRHSFVENSNENMALLFKLLCGFPTKSEISQSLTDLFRYNATQSFFNFLSYANNKETTKNMHSEVTVSKRHKEIMLTKVLEMLKGGLLSQLQLFDFTSIKLQNVSQSNSHISSISIYNMLTHKSPLVLNKFKKDEESNWENINRDQIYIISEEDHMRNACVMILNYFNYHLVHTYNVPTNLFELQKQMEFDYHEHDGDSRHDITMDVKSCYGLLYLLTQNVKYIYNLIPNRDEDEIKNIQNLSNIFDTEMPDKNNPFVGEIIKHYYSEHSKIPITLAPQTYLVQGEGSDAYYNNDKVAETLAIEGEDEEEVKEVQEMNVDEFGDLAIRVVKRDKNAIVEMIEYMKGSFADNTLLKNTIEVLIQINDSDRVKSLVAVQRLPVMVHFIMVIDKILEKSLMGEEIGDIALDEDQEKLINLIQAWLYLIPDLFIKSYTSQKQIDDLKLKMYKAFELTYEYQEMNDFEYDNMIFKNKNQLKKSTVVVTGMILLMKKNFNHIGELAHEIGGFDEEKVQKVVDFLIEYLKIFGSQAGRKQETITNSAMNMVKSMAVEIAQGGVGGAKDEFKTSDQLFQAFDKDKSGYIDFNEFMDLCKYMGINLSKHDAMALFSKSDRDESNQISQGEFKEALYNIRAQIAEQTLLRMGITREDLLRAFIFGIIYLLFIFIFIFLGIAAFSDDTSFSSIVNSIMPLIAGFKLGSSNNPKVECILDDLKEEIKKLIEQLKQ